MAAILKQMAVILNFTWLTGFFELVVPQECSCQFWCLYHNGNECFTNLMGYNELTLKQLCTFVYVKCSVRKIEDNKMVKMNRKSEYRQYNINQTNKGKQPYTFPKTLPKNSRVRKK